MSSINESFANIDLNQIPPDHPGLAKYWGLLPVYRRTLELLEAGRPEEALQLLVQESGSLSFYDLDFLASKTEASHSCQLQIAPNALLAESIREDVAEIVSAAVNHRLVGIDTVYPVPAKGYKTRRFVRASLVPIHRSNLPSETVISITRR